MVVVRNGTAQSTVSLLIVNSF